MYVFCAILCGALLSIVTVTFLFSDRFRKDVVAGDSETKIIGILNAKGAIIVVIIAIFLGGLLFFGARSSTVISQMSKVAPKEGPLLSQTISDNVKAVRKSHLTLINQLIELKREKAQLFFQEQWLPTFGQYFSENPAVQQQLTLIRHKLC
jgi:hypothetical protein